MKLLIALWAFAIGLMVPLQGVINAKLGKEVGGPTQSSLISFSGGFLIFVIIGLFNYQNLPSFSKVISLPPYLLSGGVIGSIFVLSAIVVIPQIGATGFTALIVAGQLISTIIFDHYGIMGLQVKPINTLRIVGVILLFSGVILVNRN
ncbi:MAG: DMT family transporter [Bdellovibrionota bacterium]|nr:DMT family transporter [Bdellovibrionota bacterium]